MSIEYDKDISLFNQLLQFFEQDDRSFDRTQGETVLCLTHEGKNGSWSCYAVVAEEQRQILFYSVCPIAAPAARRAAAMEFFTRANYGMPIGNFEIDLEDGEIRYKTTIDVKDGTFVAEFAKQPVYTNVRAMDAYLPGIVATIERGIGAQEAIALVEKRLAAAPDSPSVTRSPQTLSPAPQHSGSDSDARSHEEIRPPIVEEPSQLKGFHAFLAREIVEGNSELASEQKLELAARASNERLQHIDTNLHSTLASLDRMQTVRLRVLETVGQQQEAGMDAKAERAAAALQECVVGAATRIDETYRAFAARVREIETPSLAAIRSSIAETAARMAAIEAEIEGGLEAGIVDWERSFLQDSQQAIAGLHAIGRQASERGNSIARACHLSNF